MDRKTYYLCGMLFPAIYVFMALLGGALQPGYNHITDTVGELVAPGAPNKLLLGVLHIAHAVTGVLWGIGVWQFVRDSGHSSRLGLIGAGVIIATGVVTFFSATIFPQDAWGTPLTFPGLVHLILVLGVLLLLSIVSMLLIGFWLRRARIFPGFGTYSFMMVGAVVLLGILRATSMGGPYAGLSERMAVLAGFLWTFMLALGMYRQQPDPHP